MNSARLFLTTLKALPIFFLSGCSGLQLVNSFAHNYYPAKVEHNLVYDAAHNLKYDLYLPEQPVAEGHPTPVVVFIYGGSWNRGDKAEYEFAGRRLASMGYIAALPNYRLYPEVTYPDFLIDCAKAVKAINTEIHLPKYASYKPDTQLIMMGHSAGAYNAAMLAMDPKWLAEQGLNKNKLVRGFVGLAGPYNIYPINDREVRPVFHYPTYPPESMPVDFADQPQPPSLILVPEHDDLVRTPQNSIAMHKLLVDHGNQSTMVTVAGTSHITLMGTFSPLLFFKGSTIEPIKKFIQSLYTKK